MTIVSGVSENRRAWKSLANNSKELLYIVSEETYSWLINL